VHTFHTHACRFVQLTAFCLLAGCGEPSSTSQRETAASNIAHEHIVLTGSSTMAPLLTAIAQRFEKLHPRVEIEVQAGGSERGIRDVLSGAASLGMASRPLSESERHLLSFSIARDGVSIVIHKNNPVQALSKAQVEGIYTGKITSWRDVGGPDSPIRVVNRERGYSSRDLFMSYFGVNESAMVHSSTIGDNRLILKAVASDPDTIGYVSVGEAERTAARGDPIKLLPIDGVAATSERIRSGEFPISRPLNLVSKQLPVGFTNEFVSYCLSSEVTDLIEQYDFTAYFD
jgi:phosphate transport system substrate-binding protein